MRPQRPSTQQLCRPAVRMPFALPPRSSHRRRQSERDGSGFRPSAQRRPGGPISNSPLTPPDEPSDLGTHNAVGDDPSIIVRARFHVKRRARLLTLLDEGQRHGWPRPKDCEAPTGDSRSPQGKSPRRRTAYGIPRAAAQRTGGESPATCIGLGAPTSAHRRQIPNARLPAAMAWIKGSGLRGSVVPNLDSSSPKPPRRCDRRQETEGEPRKAR